MPRDGFGWLPQRLTTKLRLLRGDSLDARLLGESTQASVLNLFAMGVTFLTSLALSRLLGTRGYGAYVYALAWPALLAVGAQHGYGQLLVRNIAAYAAREEWGLVRGLVQRSQRIVLATSAILVALAAGVGWLFIGKDQPMVRQSFFLALAMVPTCALLKQREAVLRGYRRIALGRLPQTVIQPVLLLAVLGLLTLVLPRDVGAPDVVAITVVSCLGALLVTMVFVSRATPSNVHTAFLKQDVKVWTSSARSLFLINGIQVLNLQVGIILLGALTTVEETAVFSAAIRWSGLIVFLQGAVIFPLAPALAQLNAGGARAEMQRIVTRSSGAVVVASAPIVVGLLLFGEQALGLFGEEFRRGTVPLTILVVGDFINIASGFVAIILVNADQERTLLVASAWFTVVTFVIRLVLTNTFGIEGAAIGQAVGVSVQNVVLAVLVWRRLGIFAPAIGSRRFLRRHDGVDCPGPAQPKSSQPGDIDRRAHG